METLNMITEVKFKKKGKKTRASSHETTSLVSLKDQRFDLKWQQQLWIYLIGGLHLWAVYPRGC